MRNLSCTECNEPAAKSGTKLYSIAGGGQGSFEIMVCGRCGNIYTYWDNEINLQEYYDARDYTVRDTTKSVFYRIQEFEYRKVLNRIRKLSGKEPKTLLDFGAGKGVFLHISKESGFDVKGVETSLPRANFGREQYGLTINTNEFVHGRIFDHKFDVITSIHVFEHIPESLTLMKELVAGNLEDNGICMFEVPNFTSWQSKWAKSTWMHLDVPRHINHFTPEKFMSYLEDSGLKIARTSYFSWHMGIIGMLQSVMHFFGYNGFLIGDIKQIKSKRWLILPVLVLLPFAIMLEAVAAMFDRGGVIRCYGIKKTA
jgi:2-polyprenyl-3-methyl-5-hydroxy-6-metoxy-1,4-benzoquinol methylase